MNLDKFKKLKSDISTPDLPDTEYIKSLYNLPQKSHRVPVLPIIGTVAAAFLVVIGITIWALIGRGIRNSESEGDVQIIIPADESEDGEKVPSDKSDKDDKNDNEDSETDKDKPVDEKPEDNKQDDVDEDTKKPENQEDEDKEDDSREDEDTETEQDNSNTGGNTSVTTRPVTPSADSTDSPSGTSESERDESADRADDLSKFTYTNSPLLNQNGKENKHVLPSLDIDGTGFVRSGEKLSSLKGKSLMMFVPQSPAWSYTDDSGATVSEWDWFKEIKSELGLSVKYTVKTPAAAANASRQYIMAGQQLDILYSAGDNMLQNLSMSRDLTSLININDSGSSPGVCKKTMDGYRWSGGYRVIAPVGNADVLWYNKTMSDSMGLADPYTDWKNDSWTINKFADFLKSASDNDGITTFIQNPDRIADVWSHGFGVSPLKVDGNSSVPTVINNWQADTVYSSLTFMEGALRYSSATGFSEISPGISKECMGLYGGTTLMSGGSMPIVDRSDSTANGVKLRWVPYPKNSDFSPYCVSLGYGMLLPKNTVKEDNVGAALKFMELWATRAAEARLDSLSTYGYYGMTYDEREEYYEFCISNIKTPVYQSHGYLLSVIYSHNSAELRSAWTSIYTATGENIINTMKEYSNI